MAHFDVSDYTLPDLACSAAIECDNFVRGKGKTLTAVRELTDLLRKSLPNELPDSVLSGPLDVTSVVALACFFEKCQIAKNPLETVKEVYVGLRNLVQQLEEFDKKPDREKAAVFVKYCLELSKISQRYQKEFRRYVA